MTQFSICAACKCEERNIKTRIAVEHTCDKSDPKYKEPITREFGIGNVGSFLPHGTYYKIIIHSRLFEGYTRTKYSVKRGQFLNGKKVPAGQEVWFENKLHFMDTNLPLEKCIWVHQSIYKKLAFV